MFTPFAFVKTATPAAPPAFDYVLGYTSSFVAYSVARKLSSTYTGSALRVKRSNDNSEQDIGFSNNILDTSALSSFVGANTGTVVTLYDQSGNGVDLTGGGTNGGPTIVSAGTLVTSSTSIPAFEFNGTDQWLERTTAFTSATVVEVMAVSVNGTNTGDNLAWCTPDNGYAAGPYKEGSTKFSIVKSSGDRAAIAIPGQDTPFIVDIFYNVGGGVDASFIWTNGSNHTGTLENGAFSAGSFTKINLGRYPAPGHYYNGKISEWILYSNLDTQRTNVRTNFNDFYNTY